MADYDLGLLRELGHTGLKHSYGIVREEFLPQLQGDKANKVYREMGDNDPIAGAVLYAFENMVRQVTWTVTGSRRAFVEDCIGGMSQSWEDFIAEALSKLQYGWSYHEIVYEGRGGRVVWRKLPIRGQDTLARWEIDENGGCQGMWQYADGFRPVFIPIAKALHFRTSAKRNSPQGRSILRTGYRPWHFKKRIEEIEAVGVERDLAGIPIIEVPSEMLSSSAPSEAQAAAAEFRNIVQNIRNDEQAGLVVPQAYDDRGNKLYSYGLMSSNGRRQFVTGDIIARYSQQIAMASMADVILLGHEKVGSFALSSDKSRLLTVGLQAQVDEIAAVLNKHALPRLFALNGMEQEDTRIVAGEIAQVDVAALADTLYKMALAGMSLFPSESLESHLRALADLPAADGTESRVTLQMTTQDMLQAQVDAVAASPPPVEKSVGGFRVVRDDDGLIDGLEVA